MKKLCSVLFSVIILAAASTALSSCGCSNSQNPSSNVSQSTSEKVSSSPDSDLVGNWGERADNVEAEFKNDGTCKIGGVNGTYKIDDKNTLTVTPDGDNTTPMVFEYAPSDSSTVSQNQWRIADNKLYINGYQYSKTSPESKEETKASSSSKSENTSKTTSSTASSSTGNKKDSSSKNEEATSRNQPSSKRDSSSSSKTESKPSSSESSQSSKAESKPTNPASAPSSSTPSSSSSTSSSSQIRDGEEDDMVTIYENIDNF